MVNQFLSQAAVLLSSTTIVCDMVLSQKDTLRSFTNYIGLFFFGRGLFPGFWSAGEGEYGRIRMLSVPRARESSSKAVCSIT
jgi:hypothetical protein